MEWIEKNDGETRKKIFGNQLDIQIRITITDLDIKQISFRSAMRSFFRDCLDCCCRDTTVICFEGGLEEEQDKTRTGRETFETRCFRFARGRSFDQPYPATTTRMYEDCVLQSMRFPQKLWRIVNECETRAIQWGANGDTILLNYKRFQTEYLDTHRPIFKTSNITSFIRQLNLYGFRKITCHGRDPACNSCNPHVHEFLHDNFRADRIDLLSKVCRKAGGKSRCSQHEAAKNEEESPRSETNRVSRLKLCQVYLSNASYDIFYSLYSVRRRKFIRLLLSLIYIVN